MASDSNEMQLLLRCARVQLNDEDKAEIERCLESELDCEWLVQSAREHRIDGFLSMHLSAYSGRGVDAAVVDQLKQLRRANTVANLRLTKVLCELLDALSEREVEVLPYKGPVLMQRVYGEIGIRKTRDLDLVISERDLAICAEVLLEHGFKAAIEDSWSASVARRKLDKEIVWFRGEDGTVVELHWRFTHPHFPFDLNLAGLRGARQQQPFAGRNYDCIRLEEMIVILAVHGTMHVWAGIEQLVLFAECCRQEEVDWPRVVQVAERYHQRRVLYLGLHLAAEYLQVELPDSLAERVKKCSGTVSPLANDVVGLWERGQQKVNLFDTMSFQLSLLESRRHKLRYLSGHSLKALFKPLIAAEKKERGSIWLRPFVLATRYLRRVWHLGCKLIRS